MTEICTNTSLFFPEQSVMPLSAEGVEVSPSLGTGMNWSLFVSCREPGVRGLEGCMGLSPDLGTKHTFLISSQEVTQPRRWSEWPQGLESWGRDLRFGAWHQLLRHGGCQQQQNQDRLGSGAVLHLVGAPWPPLECRIPLGSAEWPWPIRWRQVAPENTECRTRPGSVCPGRLPRDGWLREFNPTVHQSDTHPLLRAPPKLWGGCLQCCWHGKTSTAGFRIPASRGDLSETNSYAGKPLVKPCRKPGLAWVRVIGMACQEWFFFS